MKKPIFAIFALTLITLSACQNSPVTRFSADQSTEEKASTSTKVFLEVKDPNAPAEPPEKADASASATIIEPSTALARPPELYAKDGLPSTPATSD